MLQQVFQQQPPQSSPGALFKEDQTVQEEEEVQTQKKKQTYGKKFQNGKNMEHTQWATHTLVTRNKNGTIDMVRYSKKKKLELIVLRILPL